MTDISLWVADIKNVIRYYVRYPARLPKDIDTYNNISVVFLKFWCDRGRRVTLGRRAGGGRIIQ